MNLLSRPIFACERYSSGKIALVCVSSLGSVWIFLVGAEILYIWKKFCSQRRILLKIDKKQFLLLNKKNCAKYMQTELGTAKGIWNSERWGRSFFTTRSL